MVEVGLLYRTINSSLPVDKEGFKLIIYAVMFFEEPQLFYFANDFYLCTFVKICCLTMQVKGIGVN